jgi:putative hemolysin
MMRVLSLNIMMIFALGSALTFSGMAARADKDSWKLACQKSRGIFSTLKLEKEDFPVCFFGEAVVGASAVSELKESNTRVDSIKAYKNRRTASVRGGVCGAFDAELVTAKDGQGNSYNFCRFPDSSVMEETTLWLGPGATISDSMDRALKL